MHVYKPTLIVLQYDDKCKLCSDKMEWGKFGLFLGKNRGVVHEKCYKDLMNNQTTW